MNDTLLTAEIAETVQKEKAKKPTKSQMYSKELQKI